MFLVLFIVLSGCSKLDLEIRVPGCIRDEIKNFKNSGVACDSSAEVDRYDFQGAKVYVFEPGNCGADLPVSIYDEKCNLVCTLGGFTGTTKCNGIDFYDHATNKVIVWKK